MAVNGQTEAKVELVPWDPTDEKQFQRMVDQRTACGWAQDEVPEWKPKALEGKKFLYWIKLVDSYPNQEEVLKPHHDEFTYEKEPLVDTAKTIGAAGRTPTGKEFFPIGHIGLDIGNPQTKKFSLPFSETEVWITSVYVSFALQSLRLGRAAMTALERVALLPPLKATHLVLDTVESAFQLREEALAVFWEGRGRKRPEVPKANQDWYGRQGYEVVRVEEGALEWVQPMTGEMFSVPLVFMRKKIA